jgi:hypothetical protein
MEIEGEEIALERKSFLDKKMTCSYKNKNLKSGHFYFALTQSFP